MMRNVRTALEHHGALLCVQWISL